MTLDLLAADEWAVAVDRFFHHVDELPFHYVMHLLHGAEILGYKHPDARMASRWAEFYFRGCEEMHVSPESEKDMDIRLDDWSRCGWDQS